MSVLRIVLTVIFILVCVAMTIIVLFQEGKTNGLSSLSGSAETYWSKNKNRSKESLLVKYTSALAVLFMLLAIILNLNVL